MPVSEKKRHCRLRLSFPEGKLQWSAVTSPHNPETLVGTECWLCLTLPRLLLGSLPTPLGVSLLEKCKAFGSVLAFPHRGALARSTRALSIHPSLHPGTHVEGLGQIAVELGNCPHACHQSCRYLDLGEPHVPLWIEAALLQQLSAFQKKRESKVYPAK